MSVWRAPAKLTWSLEIGARRGDGRHELRSEMRSLAWADELEVVDNEDYLRVVGPYGDRVGEEGNLVTRALALVRRRAGVTLTKSLPPGGGLGGGSADAGAVLRWAGGVTPELALTLGSDVPFCQLGGRALVEGVGEVLTELPFVAAEVTLVLASFGVDTAACYAAYDELRDEGVRASGRNHLEQAARRVEPRLAATMDWLRATLQQPVYLAGSGSTMFVEGHLERGRESWDVTGPEGIVQFRQTTTAPKAP